MPARKAPKPITETGDASWPEADVKLFLQELIDRAAQAGDGGCFKISSFNEVAAVISPQRTEGGPKTGKGCSQKFSDA